MKAIVFSNFPKDVFDNTLKPKFDQYNIEVLRVVKIDRSENIDVSKADLLISMVELMSGGQRQKVKEIAKRAGKRYVGLHRKGGDWARDLALPMESVQKMAVGTGPSLSLVRTPPPVSLEPLPPPSAPASEENVKEDDEEAFEAMQELLDEAGDQVHELTKENAGLKEQLDAQKRAYIALTSEKDRMAATLNNAQSDLRAIGPERQKLTAQVDKLSTDLVEAQKSIEGLTQELTAARTKTTVHSLDNLFKAIEAMKVLVRQGLMDSDEAFEKLANFDPKKQALGG